jgi:hypothetical protein
VDDLDFSNFSIDTGFIKLPGYISAGIGDDIILSGAVNSGDRVGRPYYSACDTKLVFQAENCTKGCPRKVFVPLVARVRTDVMAPFMRGEILLLIISKVYKARTENRTGFYQDTETEYAPGYIEEANIAVSVYRLVNKPLIRK